MIHEIAFQLMLGIVTLALGIQGFLYLSELLLNLISDSCNWNKYYDLCYVICCFILNLISCSIFRYFSKKQQRIDAQTVNVEEKVAEDPKDMTKF